MGKINEYFSTEEFACRCGCGFRDVNAELVEVLTDIRKHYDQPIEITSGNRCAARNKAVGGEDHSKHIEGIAADFKVKNTKPQDVHDYLEKKYPDKYGIGRYPNRTHVDVRPDKARWIRYV